MTRSGTIGKLALTGLATLLALGAVEGALRVFGPPPPPPEDTLRSYTEYDADLGWRGRAGARGIYRSRHFATPVALNAEGFRDDEWTTAPAASLDAGGPVRDPGPPAADPARPQTPASTSARGTIILLGDSFAWGYGVQRGEMFADRIERALGGELRNYGVSGYGTDQELLLFRREAAKAGAGLVVIEFALVNDLDNILAGTAYRLPKPRFVLEGQTLRLEGVPVPRVDEWDRVSEGEAVKRWLTAHLRLYAWAKPRWSALKTRLRAAAGTVDEEVVDRRRVRLLAREPERKVAEGWRLAEALVRALRDDAARGGARLVLLAVPDRLQVDDALWEEAVQALKLQRSAYDRDLPDRTLAAMAARLGVPLADPLDDLRGLEASGRECFLPEDVHWNALGHEAAAECLLQVLHGRAGSTPRTGAADAAPAAAKPQGQGAGLSEWGTPAELVPGLVSSSGEFRIAVTM